MKNQLIFNTIEGKVSEIKGKVLSEIINIDFQSLDDEELVEIAYSGIFWSKDCQETWIKEVLRRSSNIFYSNLVNAFLFTMLWNYSDLVIEELWKKCIHPISRLRDLTKDEFTTIITGICYLKKGKVTDDENVIKILNDVYHNSNNFITLNAKSNSLQINHIMFENETESKNYFVYLSIAEKNNLFKKPLNKEDLIRLFLILKEKLNFEVTQKLTPEQYLIASVFYRINFAKIKAVSLRFEKDLAEQDNLTDYQAYLARLEIVRSAFSMHESGSIHLQD